MSNTHFDPTAFLDMPVDQEFTKRPPIPAMDYPATISDITAREWQSKDKYDAQGNLKKGIAYDVALTLEIPLSIREATGIKSETLQLKDSIMLDLNDQGGLSTETGANRQLRNYREALDMNKPGVVFRAREMIGRRLLVKVKHEDYQGNIQERPAGVSAAPQ